MQEVQIREVTYADKGRVCVSFENGVTFMLYRSEIRGLTLPEQKLLLRQGGYLPWTTYQKLLTGVIGLRAKKRAMFLLEKMDRTEKQLYDKLKQNGYPEECIAAAIDYVKQYHYIDDLRYAKRYVRCYQDKKSRQRLKLDLMQKGADRDIIEQALEEEFESDERAKIRALLEKRRYDYADADRREQQRTYQFLMRRGYKSSDILAVLKTGEAFAKD